MNPTFTVIIVDDEKPAREEMMDLLHHFGNVRVVAVCKNAFEAKKEIDRLHPDVIFLDISMPQQSGFEMLATLTANPIVIFVTAFDEFAIKAFEENALDYLLKPVTEERLRKTIERIQEKLSQKTTQPKTIFVRDKDHYAIVPLNDVYLIESFGNYVKLYYHDRFVLQAGSLKQVAEWVPSAFFVQINRKQIVNMNFIETISNSSQRSLSIKIKNKPLFLDVSYRKTSQIKSFFKL
jgi:two-component system, LytTR family, response regulator